METILQYTTNLKLFQCVKIVQIRSCFWSLFSCIQSEYRKIRTRKTPHLETFHSVFISRNNVFLRHVYQVLSELYQPEHSLSSLTNLFFEEIHVTHGALISRNTNLISRSNVSWFQLRLNPSFQK